MIRFYVYITLSRAFFLSGIWMIFLLRKGLSLLDVAVLDGIFWIFVIIGNVPGGFVADRVGRKRTLILALIMTALAMMIFACSATTWDIIISYILWALGTAFSVASEQAWVYDEVKHDAILKRVPPRMLFQAVHGKLQAVGILSLALSTIIGGFLAQNVSLATPIVVTAIAMVLAGSWLLFIPERNKHDIDSAKTVVKGTHDADTTPEHGIMPAINTLLKPQLLLFGIAYVFFLATLFTIGFFSQPWLESLRFSLEMIGFIQGLSFLAMSVGLALSSRLYRALQDAAIVLLIFGTALVIFGMGMSTAALAVALFLLQALLRGLFIPLADAVINDFIPSTTRATVLSILNTMQTVIMLLMELLMALIIDTGGFQLAFMIMALLMTTVCGSLVLTWFRIHRSLHSVF